MASPAEIAQTPPETPEILPADFSGWDGGDLEAALSAEPSDFELPVDYDVIFKPAAQPAKPQTSAQPARPQPVPPPVQIDKPKPGVSGPSLLPAAFYAEAEAPFEPQPEMIFAARQHVIEIEPETETESEIANKGKSKIKVISIVAASSVLLLASIVPFLYPKLRAGTAPAKHAVAPQATTISEAAAPPSADSVAKLQLAQKTAAEVQAAPHVESEMMNKQLNAPALIPHNVKVAAADEPPPPASGFGGMEGMGATGNSAIGGIFAGPSHPNVKVESAKKVEISAGVAVGLLIKKTAPVYPTIAKSAHVAGTVVLQATISKTGSIQDLHVVSGPIMLRQAATDAVKTWRYKPYLLNNQPVEVDTSISVIFNLAG